MPVSWPTWESGRRNGAQREGVPYRLVPVCSKSIVNGNAIKEEAESHIIQADGANVAALSMDEVRGGLEGPTYIAYVHTSSLEAYQGSVDATIRGYDIR